MVESDECQVFGYAIKVAQPNATKVGRTGGVASGGSVNKRAIFVRGLVVGLVAVDAATQLKWVELVVGAGTQVGHLALG